MRGNWEKPLLERLGKRGDKKLIPIFNHSHQKGPSSTETLQYFGRVECGGGGLKNILGSTSRRHMNTSAPNKPLKANVPCPASYDFDIRASRAPGRSFIDR